MLKLNSPAPKVILLSCALCDLWSFSREFMEALSMLYFVKLILCLMWGRYWKEVDYEALSKQERIGVDRYSVHGLTKIEGKCEGVNNV